MTEKTVQKEPGKKPVPSKKPKPQQEVVVQIPLSELHPFPDHPFQVREDASMRKPAVSLVLGGGHSIGVPLAVAADYSLIVPSATMVIHPVRTNGMFIGVAQTYRNMEKTQDRITGFVSAHSKITKERLEELMLDTKMLVKDVGTMLDGPQAVEEGLIDEVGGIARALEKLNELMKKAAGTEN